MFNWLFKIWPFSKWQSQWSNINMNTTGAKKALLVGINYPGTSSQLNGCVNDVMLMNDIIRKNYAFCKDNAMEIRMLTDSSATTKNILDRLKWLVDGAKPGDILLFQYSGHGTQYPVADYTNNEEPDGLDEVICPIDFDWRANVIKDNDLREIFKNVPAGVNLTVISDSCHSGTLLKDLINPLIQPATSPNKIRTIPMPPDIMNRIYGLELKPRFKCLRNASGDQIGILISGCRSDQTSADAWIQANRKYQGALTYYLSVVLSEAKYDITYRDLVSKVNIKLAAAGYDQNPQLDCDEELKDKKFLQPLV